VAAIPPQVIVLQRPEYSGVAGAFHEAVGNNQRVAQTIYEVLDELRASATSEADKGSKLERLFKAYLLADPVYADQFSNVWLWNEWPGRQGKHDTGIDLVAEDKTTAGLVAIQCKFFAPTSTINKPDIDSFLSASGKEGFAQRIIVSTTDSGTHMPRMRSRRSRSRCGASGCPSSRPRRSTGRSSH
jgi:hypothetical protein